MEHAVTPNYDPCIEDAYRGLGCPRGPLAAIVSATDACGVRETPLSSRFTVGA